ncbi:methyl-accepting chemotaxis protein [Neptunomonas phycophila]|uniref:HAMP domain-containing methyl-accepting chemotaxis protein n=2 Tax=Neptunomonas phycophila TaxID=1572645 RepID=UPI0026E11AF4|nr:methyl-accepting chemotaxis protein [Neptunomonas phycophila]MDO6468774.1 methyl-accepting chemotaxis protein [Neptunomonas phycophila]
MMLGNLRLGWKIGLGFGVVMILMAIASFFGIGSLNKAEKGVETYSRMTNITVLAGDIQVTMLRARSDFQAYLITHSEHELDQYTQTTAQLASQLDHAQKITQNPDRQILIQQALAAMQTYQDVVQRLIDRITASDELVSSKLLVRGEEMSLSMSEIIERARDDNSSMVMFDAAQVQQALMATRLYTSQYLNSGLAGDYNRALMSIENDVDELAIELGSNISTADIRVKYSNYQSESKAYIEHLNSLFQMTEALASDTAALEAAEQQMISHLLGIKQSVLADQTQLGAGLKAEVEQKIGVMLWVTVAALILGSVFAVAMSRAISKPIGAAVTIANNLAAGNLAIPKTRQRKDEVGILLTALQNTAHSLKTMISQISLASSEMSQATTRMANATYQSQQGVVSQQSETDQVMVAMEQMAVSVRDVSDSAQQAAQAAATANNDATTGRNIVEDTQASIRALASSVTQTQERISDLEKQSVNIGGILDVIRSIAEQTNLLALNAAIEAARAGEQGRGFAVVADEVRVLAQRTQQSTEQIQNLIEGLQKGTNSAAIAMRQGKEQAQKSVDKAANAREALEAITQAVQTINEMNTQIASAVSEQSRVADSVSQNVSNVRDVTEKGIQHTNETVVASDDIRLIAQRLQSMVAKFSL